MDNLDKPSGSNKRKATEEETQSLRKKNQRRRSRQKLDRAERAICRILYQRGKSVDEIGVIVNCSNPTVYHAINNTYRSPDAVEYDYSFVDDDFKEKYPDPLEITKQQNRSASLRYLGKLNEQNRRLSESGHESDSSGASVRTISRHDFKEKRKNSLSPPPRTPVQTRHPERIYQYPSPTPVSGPSRRFGTIRLPLPRWRRPSKAISLIESTIVPHPSEGDLDTPAAEPGPSTQRVLQQTTISQSQSYSSPPGPDSEDSYTPVFNFLSHLNIDLSEWHGKFKAQGLGRKEEFFAIAGWDEADLHAVLKEAAPEMVVGHRFFLVKALKRYFEQND